MSVAKKAVLGALWTVATGLGIRGISLVCTLLITRFLTREDYGEVSMAAVVVQTAHVFTNFGGQYIASKPKLGRVFHVTAFYHSFGAVAVLIVLLLRNHVGAWFGAPEMGKFIPGLVLAIVMDRVSYIPERLLVREMRFARIGILQGLGELVYATVALTLAAKGWGGEAIVIGSIGRSAVRLTCSLSSTHLRDWLLPSRITREQTRNLFSFSVPMLIASISYFGSQRWDTLVMGHLFGSDLAGVYNLAYNIADIPATQIGERIGDVLLPSFGRIEPEKRKRALVRSLTLLSLIVFPLAVGLGAVSNTVVAAILHPKWASAAPMLAILSALSVMRPVGWVVGSYLQAEARTRTLMLLEWFKAVAIVVAVGTFGRLGPLWACAMVGVVFGLNALASIWAVRRVDNIGFVVLLRPLIRPLAACAPMALAVLGVRFLMEHFVHVHKAVQLIVEVVVGGVVYVGSARVIAAEPFHDILKLVRHATKRNRPTSDDAPTPAEEQPGES